MTNLAFFHVPKSEFVKWQTCGWISGGRSLATPEWWQLWGRNTHAQLKYNVTEEISAPLKAKMGVSFPELCTIKIHTHHLEGKRPSNSPVTLPESLFRRAPKIAPSHRRVRTHNTKVTKCSSALEPASKYAAKLHFWVSVRGRAIQLRIGGGGKKPFYQITL